jgi:3-oxoacyl-[acyl-carrier protein] reductase
MTDTSPLTSTPASVVQKVALVTGASRGIGAACAIALGKAGFKVAVHYRGQEEKAMAVCALIPGAKAFRADLSDPAACQDLIKSVVAEMGGIHVLVNNAGVAIDQILPLAKPDDFDTLIATNLKPVFLLSKFAAKPMMRQKWGRIINLASVVGFTGNPGQSMYAATKAGITGFTKSIAAEMAPFGILANCVAPGFIETDMTAALPDAAKEAMLGKIPLKRFGRVEDIAGAVEFLSSEKASYITGSTIHVNGGMFTN